MAEKERKVKQPNLRAAGRFILAASLTLAALVSGSVLAQKPTPEGTLVVAAALEPKQLITNYDSYGGANYINMNIMSKLVFFDNITNDVYPDLAESWSYSDDFQTYTIKLREGVTWHDGTPFTSADVKWTLDDIVAQGNSAVTYKFLTDIASVETPDDHTVIVNLSQPNGILMENFASYNSFTVLPKHLYEGTDARNNEYNLKPVGTGPFRFVEYVPGSHVMLEANPDYYGEGPFLQRLVFQFIPSLPTALLALESGQVGYITASPPFADVPRLRQTAGIEVVGRVSPVVMWFGFNFDKPMWQDVNLRRAVALAIDRDELVDRLYQNLVNPADGYFTSVVEWANNTDAGQPETDLEEAERLLDAAGYPRGADGVRMRIDFAVFPTNIWGSPEQAQMVKQQLSRVGIDVNVQVIEYALKTDVVNNRRNFDLVHGGGLRGPDPSELVNFVGSSGSANAMRYSSAEVDELLQLGRSTADRDARREYYAELQELLAQDVPMVNLVEYAYLRPYSTKYTGFFFEDEAAGRVAEHMYNLVRLAD